VSTEPKTYSAPNSLIDLVVPLVRVRPSTFNPRKKFDEAALLELADSIREHGLLEPIVVRPIDGSMVNGDGYHYEVVAGERRYRASIMAGLGQIAVRIHPSLSDEAALRVAIIENVQRVDLDPIEEAAGYRALAELGMKQREIAESVKRSQPAVANAMRLLDLPEDVQERIQKGELSASHGVAIASWKHLPAVASKLAEVAASNGWTTKATEAPFGQYWAFVTPLKNAGLARELYDAHFDRKVCQKCPFEAYRNTGTGYGLCFKPEHFDELNETAKTTQEAERQAKIQAALSKAKADGVKLPKISALSSGSYELLGSAGTLPAGCTETCSCRGQALGYSGEIVLICTDPAHYRKLKAADTRAQNKTGREHGAELLAELESRIDSLDELGPREMAVIAIVALESYHVRKEIAGVCTRQGVGRLIAPLHNDSYGDHGKRLDQSKNRGIVAESTALELGKVVLEAIVRCEINRRYFDRATDESLGTDFYLDGKTQAPSPAVEKPEPAPTEAVEASAEDVPMMRCGMPAHYRLAFTANDDSVTYKAVCLQDRHMDILDPDQEAELVDAQRGDVCEASALQMCRQCGCTDDYGCEEGCSWVEEDLCSVCADALGLQPSEAEATCPVAGLPCDPPTCVQDCPKAEEAQQQTSLTPNAHLCLWPVTVAFQWKNGAKSGTVFSCDSHHDDVMHYVCRLGEIVSRNQVTLAAAGKLVCAYGQAWPASRGSEGAA
jgi:ParB/RepB/Spo0J family partition protein